MQYLRIENLEPGVKLAKSITGEDGRVLAGAGITISPTILKHMKNMGFQGAYIDTPDFEDIVVADVIPDDLRAKAFDALFKGDVMSAVTIAKNLVQEIKYKETLKLDLLQRQYRDAISPADAMEYIMSNVGTQFDKDIVSMFVKKFPIYPIGFTVKLSNGEAAVVVSNDVNSMRPIVRNMSGTNIDLASNPSYRSVLITQMI